MPSHENARAESDPGPRKALFAWASMILILSVIPMPRVASPDFMLVFSMDTLAHAAFYIPLGALFRWARPRGGGAGPWLLAAGKAFAFGFAIEFVQALLPWRSFELSDAAADLVGSTVGAGLAAVFPRLYLLNPLKMIFPGD